MAHTPGPWVASEGHPSDVWHVDMPGRAWSVVVGRHDEDFDQPVEEVQANAKLIAAAPDLLAALRLGLEWSADDGYPDDHCMVSPCERAFRQAARAAIAKAEGRA